MLARRSDIRRAMQRAAPAQRLIEPKTTHLPAPYGGLNGRDALDDMRPEDALRLINYDTGFGKVSVRKGSALWGTVGTDDSGFVAASSGVETLISFQRAAGARMVAAASGAIYDLTAGGENDTPLGSGFANDRWQHAVMNDVLGLVNGADAPQTYNGSALASMTVSGAGLTTTNLVGVNIFKSRSYFWEVNGGGFWFSAVNTLGGALEFFPLDTIGKDGGYLVTMVTWTRDGGAGMDDLAVFLMSSGEAIVYAGSDPGEADDWSLVGVFKIGRPIGIRCAIKIAGDALVLTTDGYSLLSKALPGARGAQGIQVSDKLGRFALDQIRLTSSSFGWEAVHYPRGPRVLVNYPVGGKFEQHVVNVGTGAWSVYRDLNARCWCVHNDRLFFGSATGTVLEADTGTSDRGANIVAVGQGAFSSLGRIARNVHVTAARPLLEATGGVEVEIGLYADYSPVAYSKVTAMLGTPASGGAEWDTAEWDTAKWGQPSTAVQGWIGHSARGYAISPSVRVEQRNDLIAWSGIALAYSVTGIT